MTIYDRLCEYLDEQHIDAKMRMDDGWARRSALVLGPWALDELDKAMSGGMFGFPRGKMKADIARGGVMIHGLQVVFDPDERSWRVDEFCVDTGHNP